MNTEEPEKDKGGRPTKYDPKMNKRAFKLALLGLTDVQIADILEIAEDTLHEWKKVHPKFSESLKKGKKDADAVIAHSLYHRAKGYSHKEDKIFQHNGVPVIVPTIQHYPPDTAAAFIWLKNRAGWKDKQEVDNTGTITIKFEDPEHYIYPSANKGDNGIPESV